VNARADISAAGPAAVPRDQARTVFGQVMGLVALTLGFLALGAYIGRDLGGGWGILAFIASFGCIIGLNVASSRGNEQVAITLLLGLGLLLGLSLGPVLSSYAEADPAAVWQAAGATGGFVAGLGAAGYATRRDLSPYYRVLFWALLGLILFGVVAIFVSIPNENLIWAVAGLNVFLFFLQLFGGSND
jgi:FtsH-binding integral membrane protein